MNNSVAVAKVKSFIGGVLQMIGTVITVTAGADYVVRTGTLSLDWEIYRLVLSIPFLKMYHQFSTGMTLFIAIIGVVVILIGMGFESSADTDVKVYTSIAAKSEQRKRRGD